MGRKNDLNWFVLVVINLYFKDVIVNFEEKKTNDCARLSKGTFTFQLLSFPSRRIQLSFELSRGQGFG